MKKTVFISIIFSLLVTSFYIFLVFDGAKKYFLKTEGGISFPNPEGKIVLDLSASRYLLKIVCYVEEKEERTFFLNGNLLSPFLVNYKPFYSKTIKTDYFYINIDENQSRNILGVKFNNVFSRYIECFLTNYYPLNVEYLVDDLFIFLKGSVPKHNLSLSKAIFILLVFFFLFFCISFFGRNMTKSLQYSLNLTVPTFIFILSIAGVNNLIPALPYHIFITSFFFLVLFFTVLFFYLIVLQKNQKGT
jgi:hypothetical protein